MLGKNNVPGYSLTQLVFVMAIVAVLGAVALPNLLQRMASYERKAVVTRLNACMAEVWQQGLASQKIQKVAFDLKNRAICLEQESDEIDPVTQDAVYKPVLAKYAGRITWPESFQIKQFFVQGVDEMLSQQQTDTVWFYILPGGMAQEVIINLSDTKNAARDQDGKKMSLVLNPFTVQFKTYDDFQSPA